MNNDNPIAEPAKAETCPICNSISKPVRRIVSDGNGDWDCEDTWHDSSPQPVIDDAPVVEIKEQAGTVRRLDSRFYCTINGKLYVRWEYAGGPEQCKHGYARCFACPECERAFLVYPSSTPTVIPDAKAANEPACQPWICRGTDCKKDGCLCSCHESKPLPSEPQPQNRCMEWPWCEHKSLPVRRLAAMLKEGKFIPVINGQRIEPSEPASMTSARSSYLLVCGNADKEPSAFDAFESAWIAAKAEKVEWPEESITEGRLREMIVYEDGPGGCADVLEIDRMAIELQAYRELKKRSAGGVK